MAQASHGQPLRRRYGREKAIWIQPSSASRLPQTFPTPTPQPSQKTPLRSSDFSLGAPTGQQRIPLPYGFFRYRFANTCRWRSDSYSRRRASTNSHSSRASSGCASSCACSAGKSGSAELTRASRGPRKAASEHEWPLSRRAVFFISSHEPEPRRPCALPTWYSQRHGPIGFAPSEPVRPTFGQERRRRRPAIHLRDFPAWRVQILGWSHVLRQT
jgi:hypothetical protein